MSDNTRDTEEMTIKDNTDFSQQNKRLYDVDDVKNSKKRRTDVNDQNKFDLIRKQIEYYFSNDNLKRDTFFREKISGNPEGWVDVKYILNCNKIKTLTLKCEDIVQALKSSHLETRIDENENVSIRRKEALPEPDLSPRKLTKDKKRELQKMKLFPKSVETIHALGALIKASHVPEEVTWVQIKDALSKILSQHNIEKSKIRNVTRANDEGISFIYMRKFLNDIEILSKINQLQVDGKDITIELINDIETARIFIENLPSAISNERAIALRKWKTQQTKKPLLIGNVRFDSVDHLKKSYKELLETTEPDNSLDDSVTKTILELLKYHPKADQKLKDVVGVQVKIREDIKPYLGKPVKCFFTQKSDGSFEDFSILKCIDSLLENIPLAD